jgi:hypothetical protein
VRIGDKYIYYGSGASDRSPWQVEIVKVFERQIAYCWLTEFNCRKELHCTSTTKREFLKEFKEKSANQPSYEQLKKQNKALRALVSEAYNTGNDSGQYCSRSGGWKSIEDQLKEIGGE